MNYANSQWVFGLSSETIDGTLLGDIDTTLINMWTFGNEHIASL